MSLSNLEYCNFPMYNAQNFALNVIDIQWCALYSCDITAVFGLLRDTLTKNHIVFGQTEAWSRATHYTWLFQRISPSTPSIPTATFQKSNKIKYGKIQSLDWHCVIVR